MTQVPEKNRGRIKRFVVILILALSPGSIPMLPQSAHAFTCPTSAASNKIEGCVVNSDTGNPVSGLIVVIITCGGYQSTADVTTDSNGHFSFQGNSLPICIKPFSAYPVSVNGVTPVTSTNGCYPLSSPCNVVGVAAYDLTWGQWAGDVQTDSTGYGSVVIRLDPARQVIVPAASLYSNTQFGTLNYEMQQSYSISHTIGVQVGGASGSYRQSVDMTYTQAFTVPPNNSQYVGEPWYAIGYYCAGSTSYQSAGWSCSQGLQNAGLSEVVPAKTWGTYPAYEYTSPGSLPSGSYCDTTQQPGSHTIKFTQTGTTSGTLALSSSITLFGVSVTLSYSATVTSGTSDTISLTIDNPTTIARTFRVYYAGGSCSSPTSEVHVWEYPSFPPDFSVSASPSSLGITQGSSGSSTPVTINVQAISGFNNPVALSASSNDPNFQLNLSPASVNPAGTTGSSTLTVNDANPSDSGSYTIIVKGQSGQVTRSASIPVNVGNDFSIRASPSSVTIPQGYGNVTQITVTTLNGVSTSVTLTATPSVNVCGFSAYFPGNLYGCNGQGSTTVSVASGGSTSIQLNIGVCFTTPPGAYSVTVTGKSGNFIHSITIAVQVLSGPGCDSGSVAVGTLITLANGTQVPVENLRPGMGLLSYNVTTNQFVTSTITRMEVVPTDDKLVIHTEDGPALVTDKATIQKLWVRQSNGNTGWMSVTQLRVGDYLYQPLEQEWTRVDQIDFIPGSFIMYDIYTTAPGNYIANGYLDPMK